MPWWLLGFSMVATTFFNGYAQFCYRHRAKAKRNLQLDVVGLPAYRNADRICLRRPMRRSGVTTDVAAIKGGGIMLRLSPWETLGYAAVVTVIFSALGGFKGVLLTDFLLFIIAMVGSVGAAYFALNHEQVGGMQGMIAHFQSTPELASKLNIFPETDSKIFISLFIIPLAVQWWASSSRE